MNHTREDWHHKLGTAKSYNLALLNEDLLAKFKKEAHDLSAKHVAQVSNPFQLQLRTPLFIHAPIPPAPHMALAPFCTTTQCNMTPVKQADRLISIARTLHGPQQTPESIQIWVIPALQHRHRSRCSWLC